MLAFYFPYLDFLEDLTILFESFFNCFLSILFKRFGLLRSEIFSIRLFIFFGAAILFSLDKHFFFGLVVLLTDLLYLLLRVYLTLP